MKKILLCGLKYDQNFGDAIINQSTRYLIEEILKNKNIKYQIEEIDMSGRIGINTKYKIKAGIVFHIKNIVYKIINKVKNILKKIKLNSLYNMLDLVSWYFTDEYKIFKQYYINKIKETDIIIFAGGGLIKYKYQNFYHYINCISKYATRYNKSVYLNAVGVEGYNERNIKCRLLKKALNRNSIKMISTRDDIETLQRYISRKDIICKKVSDSAVYANKAYESEKKQDAEFIGLGVCRDNLFIDNDINFTSKDMINMWMDIINELDKRNIKWKIYTNGLQADNEFAYKLIDCLENVEKKDIIIIPETDMGLVKTLANFKAVIATRLHSCIVSYSLQIPAIGLVWNNKLKLFGQAINYPERFITIDQISAQNIVDKLEESLEENYQKTREDYKEGVYQSIDDFLEMTLIKGAV